MSWTGGAPDNEATILEAADFLGEPPESMLAGRFERIVQLETRLKYRKKPDSIVCLS